MAITKKIEVDGKEITFAASAATPRRYREKFGGDIMQEFSRLTEEFQKNGNPENSQISIPSLEIFENIAYTMAKQGDPTIPDDVDEWLDQFGIFSVYQIMPTLIELWGENNKTLVTPKKKQEQQ